jgi:nucleoprotein TPR
VKDLRLSSKPPKGVEDCKDSAWRCDINTSAEEALKANIALLTAELESTKFELATAQKWIADYQAIAKSSEEQLADLTTASTKYKDETTARIDQ